MTVEQENSNNIIARVGTTATDGNSDPTSEENEENNEENNADGENIQTPTSNNNYNGSSGSDSNGGSSNYISEATVEKARELITEGSTTMVNVVAEGANRMVDEVFTQALEAAESGYTDNSDDVDTDTDEDSDWYSSNAAGSNKNSQKSKSDGSKDSDNQKDSDDSDSSDGSDDESSEKGITGHSTYMPYIAVSAGNMHYKTDGGSLDNKSWGGDVDFARLFDNSRGKLLVAPMVDYGHSSFDSYLGGMHAYGISRFIAGGVLARQMNNDGLYYEGSVRYGRAKTTLTSHDFQTAVGQMTSSYSTSAPTFAGHLRMGKVFPINDSSSVDMYGIYFYSRVGSMSANLTSDEHFEFESVDSHRVRLGFRVSTQKNKQHRFYSGMAYQYENGGDSRAKCRGNVATSAGVKGSSGMLEFGWQFKPVKQSPIMLSVSAVGWVGQQHGATIQAKFEKSFSARCIQQFDVDLSAAKSDLYRGREE